jgi:hypothetical protein
MPLSPLDQLHLNTTAGFLQIGEPMDAWNELEMITPLNRANAAVLAVRLADRRALDPPTNHPRFPRSPACPCRSTCCQTPKPPQSHDKTTAIAQALKTSPSTPIA